NQSRHRSSQRELVGKDALLEIGKAEPDQQSHQEAQPKSSGRQSQGVHDSEEQDRGEDLYDEIPRGYPGAAVPATAAQKNVGHDGDVVVPGDLTFALRAKGSWMHDRHIPRHAIDADVEEAAEQQSGDDSEKRFDHPAMAL